MVRGPQSGNGMRSLVYYVDSPRLVPPRRRPGALHNEIDRWPLIRGSATAVGRVRTTGGCLAAAGGPAGDSAGHRVLRASG